MRTWPELHPSWSYEVWDAARLLGLGLANENLFRRCLDAGIYDAASDVARVEVLERFGGIYADADSEALRPLDAAPFLEAGFFAAQEVPPDGSYFVTNAFMGGKAGHAILRDYVRALGTVRIPIPCRHGGTGAAFCCAWRLTGPLALTRVLGKRPRPGVMVLPPWMFFSRTITGKPVTGGEPYARHYWSSTGERSPEGQFPAAVAY